MLESDYIHATSPKPPPPIPVRVSRRSQLTAALRQHARPIVIEDQELARPFARLLRARQLRLWALGEFVADTMSYAIGRSYGANIEAHWYIARYVLPGNGGFRQPAAIAPVLASLPVIPAVANYRL